MTLIATEISPFLWAREHTFPADKLLTAREAYRMLKYGEQVAVNKTLFNKEGQQYNVWLSLDTGGAKDEYGNYPVNSYHQNYYEKVKGGPFIVGDALRSINTMVIPVNALVDNNRQRAFLVINPKEGGVDLCDAHMQIIEQVQQKT